jgi:nitrite reductase/ring-hydroxylating ferredoxin subunit/uncharacterized membrane protein
MASVARESIATLIERFGALDTLAVPMQGTAGAVVPEGSALKDVLSGTWLGHPLHPPLTDVVVGAWTSALLLDLLGGDGAKHAADLLVAAGILAAVPTALSGLSDWSDVRGDSRRVGTVHAFGNTSALLLHTMSFVARRDGERSRGKLLSGLGFAVASASAWLGGHLSFARGVGVNQNAFDAGPSEWAPVLDADRLGEGRLVGARAGVTPVVLVRRGEDVYALGDRCSHRGCALHEGEIDGDTIRCRCHGSTFRLDGSIVKGPATSPQPRFEARLQEGIVEIRSARSR